MVTIIIHRRPTVTVTVDGTELPDVTGVEGSYGFGKESAEAKVTVTRLPSWVQARSVVEIACGATDATTYTRFKGQVFDFPSYSAAPRGVDIDCRGHLIKAQRIIVPEDTDGDTPDLGVDLSNMTQAQQIATIFPIVGLTGYYDPALIGGPPHVLGTVSSDKPGAKNANVWKKNQSAMSRVQALDKIGLGFWIVEGPLPGGDFGIYRPQINPRPGPPTLTLTGGVDIGRDSTAAHNDALGVFNRVVVTGGDFGAGTVKAEETAPHPHPDPLVAFQTAPIYSSPLIEQSEPAGYANGMSAREIAQWQIVTLCQVMLIAELSTPRSDVFHLEQSVQVNWFDRLEIQQALWLKQVQWSVKAGQPFRQKLSLRGPAAVGVGGVLLPQQIIATGSAIGAPGSTVYTFPTTGSLAA